MLFRSGKSESDTRGTYENDQNWILYRLAEVYLMKAEAQYMLGDMSAGTETLKAITDRAGIIEYTVPATELDALINIYSERFREFISEGKLWYDMLRLSRRHDYLYKETFIINEILLMTSAGQQGIMRAKLTDPDAYYLPVPQYDLDNNHLLTQNPYYESLGN